MIALRVSAAARARISIAARCWSAVERPGLEGQSMFPTVATHAARNSRGAGGGSSPPAVGRVAGMAGSLLAGLVFVGEHENAATISRRTRRRGGREVGF